MTVEVTALWKRTVDVAWGVAACVEGAVGLAKMETSWQNDKRREMTAMAAEEIEALRISVDEVDGSEGSGCGWRCVYAAPIVRIAMEWR